MQRQSLKILLKKWCIDQALNHSIRTILISIVATFIMGLGVQFLIMDDDMMKMLPKELDSKIAWDAVQNEFGSTEIIFIAFGRKGEGIYHSHSLSTLWELTQGLSNLSSVDEVANISTATRIEQIDGFMEVDALQPFRDLSKNQINDIKIYLNNNPNQQKQYISTEEEYLLTIIQPVEEIGLDVFRNQVVAISDSILFEYNIHYGGTAYVTGSVPQLIREDVKALIQTGLLIMFVILLINLRSIKAVLMVLVVIIFSLIAMMGFMGWAYRITGSDRFLFALLNTSMPIILLTIANSDGVHVITKFFRELRVIGNRRRAIKSMMDTLLIPIFLTSITTITAFLTMVSSPLEPLIGYGISISIGIAWAWLLSSFMLPAIINILNWNPKSKYITEHSLFETVVNKVGQTVIQNPKLIFLSGLAVVIVGAVGLQKIIVDVNVSSFFKPGTEIRDSMDFMDNQMNGTMDLRVRIEGDIKEPDILKKMDSLQLFIEKHDSTKLTYSITNIVKQMHRIVMDDDMEFETIPKKREKINNLFTIYEMSGNSNDFRSMVDHDYKSALITAISSEMSTDEVFLFVGSIMDYIKEKFPKTIKVDVTGMIVVIKDMVDLVIRSSLFSILSSILIVGLITSFFFNRLIWGLLALIPLTSAVMLNFGLMGYFNITLNHITAILSSIIIGVGVDFSIHYISQFRRLSKKIRKEELSNKVVSDVGYPIILDAGSNMGFGALLFSAFIPVQYIGGLMVFAMLSTSFGTLLLLSSTIELIKKHLIEKV